MCKHYSQPLTEDHRHHIDAPDCGNCLLCLIDEKGPMTQEEIGRYLNISREWVARVEQTALQKLAKKVAALIDDDQYHGINLKNKRTNCD